MKITLEYAVKVIDEKAVMNGNHFVKETHVFSPQSGTFYASPEEAISKLSHNCVGKHICAIIEFEGRTWYQAGATNVFD